MGLVSLVEVAEVADSFEVGMTTWIPCCCSLLWPPLRGMLVAAVFWPLPPRRPVYPRGLRSLSPTAASFGPSRDGGPCSLSAPWRFIIISSFLGLFSKSLVSASSSSPVDYVVVSLGPGAVGRMISMVGLLDILD